jgi:hypothetical protein
MQVDVDLEHSSSNQKRPAATTIKGGCAGARLLALCPAHAVPQIAGICDKNAQNGAIK